MLGGFLTVFQKKVLNSCPVYTLNTLYDSFMFSKVIDVDLL